ncbi:hypothetical protein [Allorhizobium taibaishanense]|uniref:Uncharacterized protein n=1 Tax=Allorhizobium taibaishanense TaxID=887144 RepID=A0A7W6HMV9_9HYPH|nr:hypothetical protein [Allorhizobium taibaishanense]MBB4008051.1 hypothetical protein [Allorhizobium taibaishanense]
MTDNSVSNSLAKLQAQAGGQQNTDEVCQNCSCKVEVGAFNVVTPRDPTGYTDLKAPFGHLFIRYTLADGTVRFYRGGPTSGNKLSGAPGITEYNHQNSQPSGKFRPSDQTTLDDGWWSKMSVFGAIITHTGNWRGSYEQRTFEGSPQGIITIAEGPEHCGYHDKFIAIMRDISAARIEYEIQGPNSNSVAYTILKHTGLPTRKPSTSINPGWGTDLLIAR